MKVRSQKLLPIQRVIYVTSSSNRIYEKILRNPIENECGSYEMEQYAGFETGRSCVEYFTLGQLIEKNN